MAEKCKMQRARRKQDHISDRRTGLDRREFTYTVHIPERRSGSDRRESPGCVMDRA